MQTETGIKSHEGSGLGLAISQQYIELIGGKITVSSVLGQGTKFNVTLQASLAGKITTQSLAKNRVIGTSSSPDSVPYSGG